MTPEELEQLANATPPTPPPAAPTPPPRVSSGTSSGMGQFGELMQTMMAIETWKGQILDNERKAQQAMENRIRSEMEARYAKMASQAVEAEDPVTQQAMGFIIDLAKQAMINRNTAKSSPPSPTTTETQATLPIGQPEPSNEAQTMTISKEKAIEIADKIEDAYPDLCRKARSGELAKEDAIKLIVKGGATPADAELIYAEILDVDDDTQDPAQDPVGAP